MELLDTIAEEINASFEREEQFGAQAMTFVGERIRACIHTGELLLKQKAELRHGQFEAWLEANCPKICPSTARRRMRLAMAARDNKLDLESAGGVRQAYILAQIIPDPDHTETGRGTLPAGGYLVHVSRLERAIAIEQRSDPISKWPAEKKTALRDRLRPLVDLYQQLVA